MTREDIIRWADEVGAYPPITEKDDYAFELADLIDFAALVAAAEREAILKLLDDNWYKTQDECAEKIRARGKT